MREPLIIFASVVIGAVAAMATGSSATAGLGMIGGSGITVAALWLMQRTA